jgi:hypothetical protein
MSLIAELLEKAVLAGIGLGVAFGAAYLIYFRDAHFWRYLAENYQRPWQRPLAIRRFQHAVAYGIGPVSKSYNSILTIGLHDDGIALSVIPPFSFFHKPLFIPFADITGWKQIWYLNAKSFELGFAKAPEVKLVMPASQVEWIGAFSQGQMQVVHEHSPHGKRPNVWYAIILLQGIMGVCFLLYILQSWMTSIG